MARRQPTGRGRDLARLFRSLPESAKVRLFRGLYAGVPSFRRAIDRDTALSGEEIVALMDEGLDEGRASVG